MGEHSFYLIRRLIGVHLSLVLTILTQCVCPPDGFAQAFKSVVTLSSSSVFHPVLIRGLKIHPDDPLKFDFLIETGDTHLQGQALEQESRQLIRDFWTALTVPKQDLWVNLSPYEKDRMIPDALGQTRMGQDLLAQDYFLKQLTASLMNPESEAGRKFWDKVYEKIYQDHGVTDIPVETFHKVWIVPQATSVYENPATNSVVVVKSKLDVMLEEDYLGNGERGMVDNNQPSTSHQSPTTDIKSIIRETILPLIKEEINHSEQFARLRQIVNAIMLAEWYKTRLTNSVLNQVYSDQNKINGIASGDSKQNEKIFSEYVKLFSDGNEIIAENYDPVTQQIIPQKYFSGGFKVFDDNFAMLTLVAGIGSDIFHGELHTIDSAMMTLGEGSLFTGSLAVVVVVVYSLYAIFNDRYTEGLQDWKSFLHRDRLTADKNTTQQRTNFLKEQQTLATQDLESANRVDEGLEKYRKSAVVIVGILITLAIILYSLSKTSWNTIFDKKEEVSSISNEAMLALSFAPLLMAPNIILAIGFLWLWGIGLVGFLILFWVFKYKSMPDEPPPDFKDNVKTDKAQLDSRFRENDVVVSAPAAKGGIDLAQMNVEAGKSGEGIQMKFDPVLLEKLRSAKTFHPVIFGIRPADAGILQNAWGIPAR